MRQPPLQVIAALIAANPDSLEIPDGIGRLALHNAIRYGATHQVRISIIISSPIMKREYFVMFAKSADLVHTLTCNINSSFNSKHTLTPYHPLLIKIVSFLISAAPRAVYVKASDGSLPIHLACLYCGRLGLPIIRYLVFSNPESVMIADGHGLLPKDLVLDNPCTSDVSVEMLSILSNGEKQLNKLEGQDYFDEAFSMNLQRYTYNVNVDRRSEASRSSGSDTSGKFETKLCVVCMERDVSRVLNPCGHVCLCSKCSTQNGLDKMHGRCPECRSKIREAVKFYGRVLHEA